MQNFALLLINKCYLSIDTPIESICFILKQLQEGKGYIHLQISICWYPVYQLKYKLYQISIVESMFPNYGSLIVEQKVL